MIDIYKILLKPLNTEKTNKIADRYNRFVFKVASWANKAQVREAIEKIFNVNVHQVGIINVQGKKRKFRQKLGKRSDWKKAIVKLAKGQDIKIAELVKN